MAKDSASQFNLVFDAKELRTLTSYSAENLDTGRLYRFKVSAYNFNGEGLLSEEMTTYACVAPSKMAQPQRVSSTISTFTLSWKEPSDNGGCQITGYAVFRNDGQKGRVTIEANTIRDSNIRDQPTLRSITITNFPSGSTGLTFMYQVEVFNYV